jgi:hypothetical protein
VRLSRLWCCLVCACHSVAGLLASVQPSHPVQPPRGGLSPPPVFVEAQPCLLMQACDWLSALDIGQGSGVIADCDMVGWVGMCRLWGGGSGICPGGSLASVGHLLGRHPTGPMHKQSCTTQDIKVWDMQPLEERLCRCPKARHLSMQL